MPGFEGPVYAHREKQRTPVKEMDYWTNGYFVLLRIIEGVLGEDIETIAQRQLFQPLQMHHTSFDWQKADALGRVLPYSAQADHRLTELAQAPPLGETGLVPGK